VYAIVLGWPAGAVLTLEDVALAEGGRVELLGRGPVRWQRDGTALRVELGEAPRDEPAFALALRGGVAPAGAAGR
jgi:hypothetical protein